MAMTSKDFRAKRKAEGVCIDCGGKRDRTGMRCGGCRQKNNAIAARRRNERVASRLCGACGETVQSGTVCAECQHKAREYRKKRYDDGLCAECQSPRLPQLTTCEACRVAGNVRSEKRRGLKISKWKKRGRRLFTEAGRPVSHEEAVRNAVRAAAVQIHSGVVCACGYPIEKPERGAMPKRCNMCQYDFEREQKRNKWAQNGNTRGPRLMDDAEKIAANKARKERAAAAMRKRRALLKLNGKCVGCGKDAREGVSTCLACSKKNTALHAARKPKKVVMV